ncbi:unnamed protein product, partial [marine sediment metagenome]
MGEIVKREEEDVFDFPISNMMMVLFGVLALVMVFRTTPLVQNVSAYYSSQL